MQKKVKSKEKISRKKKKKKKVLKRKLKVEKERINIFSLLHLCLLALVFRNSRNILVASKYMSMKEYSQKYIASAVSGKGKHLDLVEKLSKTYIYIKYIKKILGSADFKLHSNL